VLEAAGANPSRDTPDGSDQSSTAPHLDLSLDIPPPVGFEDAAPGTPLQDEPMEEDDPLTPEEQIPPRGPVDFTLSTNSDTRITSARAPLPFHLDPSFITSALRNFPYLHPDDLLALWMREAGADPRDWQQWREMSMLVTVAVAAQRDIVHTLQPLFARATDPATSLDDRRDVILAFTAEMDSVDRRPRVPQGIRDIPLLRPAPGPSSRGHDGSAPSTSAADPVYVPSSDEEGEGS